MKRKKHEFSEEEKKYIINNWGKETPHSMKKKFGCSWAAISNMAAQLGLDPLPSKKWTKEEELKLEELAPIYHYKIIAKILNRTNEAIYQKARKLGIKLIMDRRKWTKEEKEFFEEKRGNVALETLAKNLRRTKNSLIVESTREKLGPLIDNNLNVIKISLVCEILGVSRDIVINNWYKKKGLKVDFINVTRKRKYMAISIDNLLSFLKENQNIWDATKLEKNILGLEPEWLIEKRKHDVENPPVKEYSFWSDWQKETALKMQKNGKNYDEIAKIIGRSSTSVRDFLYGQYHKIKKISNDKKEEQKMNDKQQKLDDEAKLIIKAKEKDNDATQQLLQKYEGFIKYKAYNYFGVRSDIEDIIQEGRIGIINAINNYNFSFNVPFKYYVMIYITHAINKYFSAYNKGGIHIPAYITTLMIKVKKVKSELEIRNGTIPSDEDIATELNVPLATIKEVLNLLYTKIKSMSEPIYNDKDGTDIFYEDSVGTDPEELYQRVEDNIKSELLNEALSKLTTTEKKILFLRKGLITGEEMSCAKVGKILNLKDERVRIYEKKALSKARHPMITKQIKEFGL